MTGLYPRDSLEDLVLRGYHFQEAAKVCRMGTLDTRYKLMVRDRLMELDRGEYLALRVAADMDEGESKVFAFRDDARTFRSLSGMPDQRSRST